MSQITGNKGEWSEIYTLLKILGDRKLFAGDGDLNKIESLFFPIIQVLRDESNGTFEFSYDNHLIIVKESEQEFKIPIRQFQEQASSLLIKLKEKTKASFSVPETQEFLSSFNCVTLKAKSSVKSDIRIVIHDLRTGTTPELGFSIKSQLGASSTLLNASGSTNFIYQIENAILSAEQIEEINNIGSKSKIKERIGNIVNNNGLLKFAKINNPVFQNNLTLIDSYLPSIIAEMLYLYFSSDNSKTSDLVDTISSVNPLRYNLDNEHPFYSYKIKRFLTDIALGMMPAKVWSGQLDATGGYLVVKEDGEVLCYHIYNRNEFEDYLFYNTKFETASSSKHDFGKIYTENGNLFIKLNLQIRFI